MSVTSTLPSLPGLSRQPSAPLDFWIPGTSPGMTVEFYPFAGIYDGKAPYGEKRQ